LWKENRKGKLIQKEGGMSDFPDGSLLRHFEELQDPRVERTKKHKLMDMVAIAICGVICGADNWVEIAYFGEVKEAWLRQFLELPNGIPSHDTFNDVFARIKGEEFQRCFMNWVQAVAVLTEGEVVSVDGKALRRSHDKTSGKEAIWLVNAWASQNHLALGQRPVDDKSNEITAIPTLLKLLTLKGCIVTIDAIGCQTDIAQTIVDQEADYVLSVKKNQPSLYEDLEELFKGAMEAHFHQTPHSYARTLDKGHGRVEVRRCWTLFAPEFLAYVRNKDAWANLQTVIMVQRERHLPNHDPSLETAYFISSLSTEAAEFLKIIRSHWGVENGLHWVLDMAFREDDARLRKGYGDQNFAVLRQLALNLLRQDQSTKLGVKGKRLKAGWDEVYLRHILASAI
jgi:predicted transposase YbfD/YdcC